MTSGKPLPILFNDCELFEQEMCPYEYEYFQKHIQAFKSMWMEKSEADKRELVLEFFNYSENFGYIKDFPLKTESKMKFFNQTKEFLLEQFARAKYSVAKNLVSQIASIASNREKVLHCGSLAKGKDPFYNIETRETFRTFFGEPGHPDTFKKAVANMPLYTRFGGAICRVLRRWVEGYFVPPELQELKNRFNNAAPFDDFKPGRTKACSAEEKSESEPNNKSDHVTGMSMWPEEQKPEKNHDKNERLINDEKSKMEAVKGKTDNEKEIDKLAKKGEIKAVFANTFEKESEKKLKSTEIGEGEIERKAKVISKDENAKKKETKRRHHCGYCMVIEDKPKEFKKCSLKPYIHIGILCDHKKGTEQNPDRCKGKGTRFYCSKDCQAGDWIERHRQEHIDKDLPGFIA